MFKSLKLLSIHHHIIQSSLRHYQNLVIDCSFDDVMTSNECYRLAREIQTIYYMNSNSNSKFKISICSQQNDGLTIQFLNKLLPLQVTSSSNGSITAIIPPNFYVIQSSFASLFPSNSLVYLSPDANDQLEFNHNDVYVVGGVIEKFCFKNSLVNRWSHDRASQLGIRSARFPIDHLMDSRMHKKILFLPQIFTILSLVSANFSWESAVQKAIPQWKLKQKMCSTFY